MSDKERRQQIRERLAKATPGPWDYTEDTCDCGGEWGCNHGSWPYELIAQNTRWEKYANSQPGVLYPRVIANLADGDNYPEHVADADLIANAPSDLAWYDEQLRQTEQGCNLLALALKQAEERATQAEAERDALRRIVDSECPIGALDLVTSLRAELQHVRERAEAAEQQVSVRESQLADAKVMIANYVGERDFWQKQAREQGEKAERQKARAEAAERLLSDAPKNLSLLPPELQRLWEACVELSEKGEFKALVRYLERVEGELKQARAALAAKEGQG